MCAVLTESRGGAIQVTTGGRLARLHGRPHIWWHHHHDTCSEGLGHMVKVTVVGHVQLLTPDPRLVHRRPGLRHHRHGGRPDRGATEHRGARDDDPGPDPAHTPIPLPTPTPEPTPTPDPSAAADPDAHARAHPLAHAVLRTPGGELLRGPRLPRRPKADKRAGTAPSSPSPITPRRPRCAR